MQPLANCTSRDLVVYIQTENRDWSFIYDIVENVDIRFSNEPNKHPIPYGTEITDHIKRNMDEITISGAIGCLSCSGETDKANLIIPELKRLSDRFTYCKEDFATLTSNDWQARYMILTSVDIKEEHHAMQTKEISTTWLGANLVGDINNPEFKRGGIIY